MPADRRHLVLGLVRRSHGALLSAAAVVVLAACASTGTGSPGTAPQEPAVDTAELDDALARCTVETGYDPDAPATRALGPNELGAGELAWRACATEQAARIVRPQLIQPEALDSLLETDRRLTEAIQAGQATRAEREETMTALVADIRDREAALRAAVVPLDSAAPLREDPFEQRLRRELEIMNRLIR